MKCNVVVIISLFLVYSFVASAQETSKSYSPDQQAKCYPVHFEKDRGDTFSISFRSVHVHDVRPDTTKLGYFNSDITNSLHKICTPVNEFDNYLQSFLSADHSGSLYDLEIFITKGWISSDLKSREISLSTEIFIKSDVGFHPLYKFDSVAEEGGKVGTAINTLQNLMKASLAKLSTFNYEQKLKRVLSESDIASRYNPSRYAFNKPKNKGVYMNLQEFKDDRPSYTDFQISFNKLTDELFVKGPSSNYVLTREAWGFFDGKMLFIAVGENYFPVDQDGNALNFFAASKLKKEHRGYQPAPQVIPVAVAAIDYFVVSKKRKLVKLKPYQLNFLTGEIY